MNYWLMKSEPDEFGIDDLKARPNQIEPWDGVRNYQARNMLRDAMQVGDQVFFYHSNCQTPGIVGIMEIARAGYPDDKAFDSNDKHFDPKSNTNKPTWFRVDVKFVAKFPRIIPLVELKQQPVLSELALLRRGNRLSIMPVSSEQWAFVLAMV